MKKYSLTVIGAVLASIVYLTTIILEMDLFEAVLKTFESLERFEVDEFVIPVFILLVFTVIDLIQKERRRRIEVEKIKIYKAMLTSSHHILNNFLNQAQLFKLVAEETPGFDPEVLSFYDLMIKYASNQVDALGSLADVNETSILAAVAPLSDPQPGTGQGEEADAGMTRH